MRVKFVEKYFGFGLCEMFFSEIFWFSKGQKRLFTSSRVHKAELV